MKKAINKLALISILFIGLISCENNGYEDFKQANNPSVELNGEWYITITDAATGKILVDHALHRTFDSNDGKMYISDRVLASNPPKFTGWALETKLDINTTDLTFSATNTANSADGSKVKITEGKITKNAAKSKDGNTVDSIYFKAVFDYEPTQTLIYSGHKRTGFEEDNY